MKKVTLCIGLLLATQLLWAGGMVHNTNQSAAWIRTLCRDASTDIDAVFFNPAGLTKLSDGFHIGINSQTVGQSRSVKNDYQYLSPTPKEYAGETFVPFLPTAFMAYKKGKLAVWAGFIITGGGGSSEFKDGLPSFEIPVSNLVPGLSGLKAVGTSAGQDLSVNGYSANIAFTGTSLYLGIQVGASYAINDMLSVSLGARYVKADNAYNGHLTDISIVNGTTSMRADDFLTKKAIPTLNGLSANLTSIMGIPAKLKPAIDGGAGPLTLDQMVAAQQMSATDAASIKAGVKAVNPAADPNTMTLSQISGLITGATPALTANKAQLDGTAAQLTATAAGLGDKQVKDVKRSGSTITPIVGVNLSLMENKLNVGLRYEHASKMKLTTTIEGQDDTKTFTDGEEVEANLPGVISLGADYKITDNLSVTAGFHYYLDKSVSYGKTFIEGTDTTKNAPNDKVLDGNAMEVALSLQYAVNSKLAFSAGYLMTSTKPKNEYQSDTDHSLSTNSVGFGTRIYAMDNLAIDLGFLYTFYTEATRTGSSIVNKAPVSFTETYNRTAWVGALGVSYSF